VREDGTTRTLCAVWLGVGYGECMISAVVVWDLVRMFGYIGFEGELDWEFGERGWGGMD
jgi:hypothetical protein